MTNKLNKKIKELKRNILSHGEVNGYADVDSHMIYAGDVMEETDKLLAEISGNSNKKGDKK